MTMAELILSDYFRSALGVAYICLGSMVRLRFPRTVQFAATVCIVWF